MSHNHAGPAKGRRKANNSKRKARRARNLATQHEKKVRHIEKRNGEDFLKVWLQEERQVA